MNEGRTITNSTLTNVAAYIGNIKHVNTIVLSRVASRKAMSTQSDTVRRVEAEIIERSYRVQLLRLIYRDHCSSERRLLALLAVDFIHSPSLYVLKIGVVLLFLLYYDKLVAAHSVLVVVYIFFLLKKNTS